MSDETVLRHWQIKDFPDNVRKRVATAAARDQLTVAQWLERIINAALADGGQPDTRISARTGVDEFEDLCRVVKVACDYAQHRDQMQKDLSALISRRLKEELIARKPGLLLKANLPEPSPSTAPEKPSLLQSAPRHQFKINVFDNSHGHDIHDMNHGSGDSL